MHKYVGNPLERTWLHASVCVCLLVCGWMCAGWERMKRFSPESLLTANNAQRPCEMARRLTNHHHIEMFDPLSHIMYIWRHLCACVTHQMCALAFSCVIIIQPRRWWWWWKIVSPCVCMLLCDTCAIIVARKCNLFQSLSLYSCYNRTMLAEYIIYFYDRGECARERTIIGCLGNWE